MSVQAIDARQNGLAQLVPNSGGFYLACFFICYVSAGVVTQIYSGIHPTIDGSPLDYFTGGALWMMSAICLVHAMAGAKNVSKLIFWLAGSGALALLAIDEFIGMHEATQEVVGDDDHIKVFLWLFSGSALLLISKVLQPSRLINTLFLIGWLFQTIYLMTDLGDGDYFTLPFALSTLQWTEDIVELMCVSTFMAAFLLITSDKLQLTSDEKSA